MRIQWQDDGSPDGGWKITAHLSPKEAAIIAAALKTAKPIRDIVDRDLVRDCAERLTDYKAQDRHIGELGDAIDAANAYCGKKAKRPEFERRKGEDIPHQIARIRNTLKREKGRARK